MYIVYTCIDPIVAVEIVNDNSPEIYRPLILQCTATIVRGITSRVDIIWTTGDTQVRRVNNVIAISNINSTSVYYDSFIIPSLNISDIGIVYQCEVLINSVVPTTAKANFTIPIPGIYVFTYIIYTRICNILIRAIKCTLKVCDSSPRS